MADQSITLPELVADALKTLNEDKLSTALGEYLDDRQIRAILTRRDLVLDRWPVTQWR